LIFWPIFGKIQASNRVNMQIKIFEKPTDWAEIKKLAEDSYGEMVKAVADIKLGILAIGGEMHADAEQLLLEQGSRQDDLWGFNIYPDAEEGKKLEYVSFINIRPKLGNRSQEIADAGIKDIIKLLVDKLIV